MRSLFNKNVVEAIGKIMGESCARGKERELHAKMNILMARLHLMNLELDLFLAGGPVPSEEE